MPKIKEFVANVLAEIDRLRAEAEKIHKRPLKSKLGEYFTEDWAVCSVRDRFVEINEITPEKLREKEEQGVSAVELAKLRDFLRVKEEEISFATLKDFIADLIRISNFVKNTNFNFNAASTATSTRVCLAIATHLHETMTQIVKPKENEPGGLYSHPYDYLFEGYPCRRFISSKGTLGDLSLAEFFWTSEGKPVEVLYCLDSYKKIITDTIGSFRPPHVCIKRADWDGDECPELDGGNDEVDKDRSILWSHSDEAYNYYMAIVNPDYTEQQKLAFRDKLIMKMNEPDFLPGYSYDYSNQTLIDNGALDDFHLKDLHDFALLFLQIKPADWMELISCIDDTNFEKIVLPKRPSASNPMEMEPDPTICMMGSEEKLKAFIQNKSWYIDRTIPKSTKYYTGENIRHHCAVLFLLAEMLIRNRDKESKDQEGTVGKFTGYGYSKKEKIESLRAFQRFLVKSFQLNMFRESLPSGEDVYYKILMENNSRTALLGQHALDLYDELLAQNAITSVEGNINNNNNSKSPLFDSAQFAGFVRDLLSVNNPAGWERKASMILTEDKISAMAAYFKKLEQGRGLWDREKGFSKFASMPCHYKQGKAKHNKAVSFLLAHYYENDRQGGDEHESYIGSWLDEPTKEDKDKAVKAFKLFLISETPANELDTFLAKHPEFAGYEKCLHKAKNNYSKLRALAVTASEACGLKFYESKSAAPPVEARIAPAPEPAKPVEEGGIWSMFSLK